MSIIKRLWRITTKRCTQCGSKCKNIRKISSKGFVKEWCDNCVGKILNKMVPKCLECRYNNE